MNLLIQPPVKCISGREAPKRLKQHQVTPRVMFDLVSKLGLGICTSGERILTSTLRSRHDGFAYSQHLLSCRIGPIMSSADASEMIKKKWRKLFTAPVPQLPGRLNTGRIQRQCSCSMNVERETDLKK